MNKEENRDHEILASLMEWDELACFIIDLELKIEQLLNSSKQKQAQKYNKILDIYELEKQQRVMNLSVHPISV